jgi:Protein of unknown function (DUF2846)
MSRPLIALVMVLFAHSLFAQEPKTGALKPVEQSATTENATDTPLAPAGASVGLVHVYRQRRFVGSALAPSIFVDDQQVARVGNGRRFTARLMPGMHGIRSDDKSSSISLDVKPGQDYYIRIDEEPGAWKGHGKLTLLQSEQGKPEYALVKPIEPERRLAKDMLEEESETSPDVAGDKRIPAK